MTTCMEVKACKACAKAKRRCDKEQPTCRRCGERGIACAYPPAKLTAFLAVDTLEPLLSEGYSGFLDQSTSLVSDLPGSVDKVPPVSKITSTSTSTSGSLVWPVGGQPQPSLSWCLAADTWKIDHRPVPYPTDYDNSALHEYVERIEAWLGRWVQTGQCPFVHRRLYHARLPDAVQVAYGTLAAYRQRTAANKDLVLRIVEEQAAQLLATAGAPAEEAQRARPDDLVEHIARTQALVVYQVIGLFDGDIRARHLAEARLSRTSSWARALVQCAAQTLGTCPGLAGAATATPGEQISAVAALVAAVPVADQRWHLWVLSESVRRTWLVASSVETTYLMLRQGWCACAGGIAFSTGRGLWEAPSSAAWEDCCREADAAAGFAQVYDTHTFFSRRRPADVDEFGQTMMEFIFGQDRLARWRSGQAVVS